MARPRKLRLKKRQQADPMQCRAFTVIPSTLKEKDRSVDAVFATEIPVNEYCHEREEVLPTVILMSGCRMPADGTLVMLDNHLRSGLPVSKTVKGSGVNCRIENRELVGTLVFASKAEDEWQLAREGHLKAVSIGRVDHVATYVPEGATKRIDGRDWVGPMVVVTDWSAREISLTPVGADIDAVMRNKSNQGRESDQGPNAREQNRSAHSGRIVMNPILKALLVARGLKKDATDDDAAVFLVERGMPTGTDPAKIGEWVESNMAKLEPAVTPPTNRSEPPTGQQPPSNNQLPANIEEIVGRAVTSAVANVTTTAINKMKADEIAARAALASHLKTRNESLKWDDATINRILTTSATVQDADNAVFEEIANRAGPAAQIGNSPISSGLGQDEKFSMAYRSAVLSSYVDACRFKDETRNRILPKDKEASQYAADLSGLGTMGLCRAYCEALGIRTWNLSADKIVKFALCTTEHQREMLGMRVRGGAYHVTGNFASLTIDAQNKTLMGAFMEAPQTWKAIWKQAESVKDFKPRYVAKLSGAATPRIFSEDDSIPKISFSDERESYTAESYGAQTSFSWRLFVNDDLSAFSRVIPKMGQAAARLINEKAWTPITANPTMNDGQALFLETPAGNRKRKNLTTGVLAPSVISVQTLRTLMGKMHGLNTKEAAEGEDRLGLKPKFIWGPLELETTILQLVNSLADPASSNANVFNPVRQNLIPVIEPLLSDSSVTGYSTTAWGLATDPNDCDTIELAFLQGQETPVVNEWNVQDDWSLHMSVVQSFGYAPLDHRGLQKAAGA